MGELNELHYLALTGKKKGVALPTGNLKHSIERYSASRSECYESRVFTITMISPPSPVPGTGTGTRL